MSKVLGYDRLGKPIYPAVEGYIYPAAALLCSPCLTTIREVGGPGYGSICPACAARGRFTTQAQAEAIKKAGVSV